MKKRKRQRVFGRKTGPRKALLISVARSLVLKEKIKTTEAKAKETSPFVEKLITKAKKGDLSARRYLLKYFEPSIVKKMIEEIGPRYKTRKGGYTRIVKLGARKSDGARMAMIELVK
ncbi:50S ribosomal protein L17 [Patescibacteria group bacterium]|nr:50S ribosomal protein L17 [Patescibacteria group bacterium]